MKDPKKLWMDICLRFALQSRCKSRQVGAILIKDDALLAEGWNSAPKGSVTEDCPRMKCKFIQTRESIEKAPQSKSKFVWPDPDDPSTHSREIIEVEDKKAANLLNKAAKEVFEELQLTRSGQNLDQAICCHAESNMIGNCAKRGVATNGATLYCTTLPCSECSKLIIAAGIIEVVYGEDYDSLLTRKLLGNAGILVRQFEEKTVSPQLSR